MPFEMEMIYFWSAVVGGGLLVIQVVLALLGGGDADLEADADVDVVDGGTGISFRTVVAFLTFFGIGGMAAHQAGLSSGMTLVVALAAGAIAFWLVGLLMFQLTRLRSSGNVVLQNAVGKEGKVYLTVPAEGRGEGKVTVPIQGRTIQLRAITRGPAISTGKLCRVIEVHAQDTLVVESL